jgi:hypothetical protein
VCTPDQRQTIDLETGVQWQRLTRGTDAEVDFLFVVYEVGGASSASGKFVRHHGREYGIIQADGCGSCRRWSTRVTGTRTARR